jgi:acetyl-CoA synthetase
VSHPAVAEVAVIEHPNEIQEEIYAFVTLNQDYSPSDELARELNAHLLNEIGDRQIPRSIRFTEKMPKTPSGKLMRWRLSDLVTSEEV